MMMDLKIWFINMSSVFFKVVLFFSDRDVLGSRKDVRDVVFKFWCVEDFGVCV